MVLLRDDIRVLVSAVDAPQPGENQVRIGVIRLGFLFRGDGAVKLVAQFRHLKRGQKLAGFHLVAKVHIDLLQITGNLRVQFDLLIRTKLG